MAGPPRLRLCVCAGSLRGDERALRGLRAGGRLLAAGPGIVVQAAGLLRRGRVHRLSGHPRVGGAGQYLLLVGGRPAAHRGGMGARGAWHGRFAHLPLGQQRARLFQGQFRWLRGRHGSRGPSSRGSKPLRCLRHGRQRLGMDRRLVRGRVLQPQPGAGSGGSRYGTPQGHARWLLGQRRQFAARHLPQGRATRIVGAERRLPLRVSGGRQVKARGRRQAMKSKLALGTMLAVALVAPAALPCGAPFGNGINVDPKQDIVVVHKNGTETYVFQPRFCGSAKEFGLILPVPAKLSAQPALSKAEVFTKLVELSQPQTVYTTACTNRNVGGTTGATAGTGGGSGTVVVSSGSVGFMDYAQLEAGSVDALTAWLTANGYPYDSLATSAFDYYVQKGWYFLKFKVSQGAFTGDTNCKGLGPVKLSFPTSIPVVPPRMASARSKDNSGTLSYSSTFSWRIFGITEGSQQVGFADGASSTRTLNFSGLLGSTDVSSLDGLAASGNRATKLTTTFSYGSTAPDVGLGLVAGLDYRETITQVSYIQCNDGGVDSAAAPPPADAAADLARPLDVAPVAIDGSLVRKDATV